MQSTNLLNNAFSSADEAFSNACRLLCINGDTVDIQTAEQGVQRTLELLNATFVFKPWYNPVIVNPVRKFPRRGAEAEFLWYMTGSRKAADVSKYLKNWNRFADKDGNVNSNYGHYWQTGIAWCIQELLRDKYSRRAVMNIFANSNAPFGADTPCTLSLQFFIRNNQLHLICNMRSNDIWYGFCIDQYCNTMLHRLVLAQLKHTYQDLQLGYYYHNAASFHAYDNTASKATLQSCEEYAKSEGLDTSSAKPDYRLANVDFDNFWLSGRGLFDDDIFKHFKQIAIDRSKTNLIR